MFSRTFSIDWGRTWFYRRRGPLKIFLCSIYISRHCFATNVPGLQFLRDVQFQKGQIEWNVYLKFPFKIWSPFTWIEKISSYINIFEITNIIYWNLPFQLPDMIESSSCPWIHNRWPKSLMHQMQAWALQNWTSWAPKRYGVWKIWTHDSTGEKWWTYLVLEEMFHYYLFHFADFST